MSNGKHKKAWVPQAPEYMSGGSIFDLLRKQKGVFTLPTLIRVAIDVSKGMN